jgi:hypothetical protein
MLTIFKASLYDMNKAIEPKELNIQPVEEIVSELYHEFLPLCSKVLADLFPPHRLGIAYEVHLRDR